MTPLLSTHKQNYPIAIPTLQATLYSYERTKGDTLPDTHTLYVVPVQDFFLSGVRVGKVVT